MHDVLHAIKSFVESFPPGLFPLLLAIPALSVFQSKIHKWLSVQSPKVKVFISLVLSTLVVLLPHWIGILNGDKNILGAYTTMVLSGMSLFYNWVLKEKPQLDAALAPETVNVPELKQPETPPAPAEPVSDFGPQE